MMVELPSIVKELEATNAKLVELLKEVEGCLSVAIRIESNSFDEAPSPVSEWDYNADMLLSNIRLALTKAGD